MKLLYISCFFTFIIALSFANELAEQLPIIIPKYYSLKSTGKVCVRAPCPSWSVTDLNGSQNIIVHTLKFSKSINQSVVFDGDFARDVVHHGYLQYTKNQNGEADTIFNIQSSYRALPLSKADQSTRSGKFYHVGFSGIVCVRSPCPSYNFTLLNTNINNTANAFSHPYSKYTKFDSEWLHSKIFSSPPAKAIVQANVFEGTIIGKVVFVNIEDPIENCPPLPIVDCIKGFVPVFKRDSNRCIHTDGCVKPGICTLSIPECTPGYNRVSFKSSPNACPAYYCDAYFLTPSKIQY